MSRMLVRSVCSSVAGRCVIAAIVAVGLILAIAAEPLVRLACATATAALVVQVIAILELRELVKRQYARHPHRRPRAQIEPRRLAVMLAGGAAVAWIVGYLLSATGVRVSGVGERAIFAGGAGAAAVAAWVIFHRQRRPRLARRLSCGALVGAATPLVALGPRLVGAVVLGVAVLTIARRRWSAWLAGWLRPAMLAVTSGPLAARNGGHVQAALVGLVVSTACVFLSMPGVIGKALGQSMDDPAIAGVLPQLAAASFGVGLVAAWFADQRLRRGTSLALAAVLLVGGALAMVLAGASVGLYVATGVAGVGAGMILALLPRELDRRCATVRRGTMNAFFLGGFSGVAYYAGTAAQAGRPTLGVLSMAGIAAVAIVGLRGMFRGDRAPRAIGLRTVITGHRPFLWLVIAAALLYGALIPADAYGPLALYELGWTPSGWGLLLTVATLAPVPLLGRWERLIERRGRPFGVRLATTVTAIGLVGWGAGLATGLDRWALAASLPVFDAAVTLSYFTATGAAGDDTTLGTIAELMRWGFARALFTAFAYRAFTASVGPAGPVGAQWRLLALSLSLAVIAAAVAWRRLADRPQALPSHARMHLYARTLARA